MIKCWNDCSKCSHQKMCKYTEEYKQLKEDMLNDPKYDITKDNFLIGLECKNFMELPINHKTFPGGF